MKKSKFSETKIVSILKENEAGISIPELGRKYNVSTATLYNWKAKFGGMDASQLKRLKELEAENRKLKELYADVSLQNHVLKDVIEKKL